jgi:hydroxymethylpyrimidine/phosphomethylpyrimidine kinase
VVRGIESFQPWEIRVSSIADRPPVVLILAGNDPSGGAGICADTQAVTALGAHPAPVITALTVQDTRDAYAVEPVTTKLVVDQAEAVLADLPVAAIKLGLLGTAELGRAIAALLARHPTLPTVIDPVLHAAGGAALAEAELTEVYQRQLAPRATVLTPNALESRRLAPAEATPEARGRALLAAGASWVLVKGGDEDTPEVHDLLLGGDGNVHPFRAPRLAGRFHGSGCTLASAIAARLAHGDPVPVAVGAAQARVQRWLAGSWALGRGQRIPARR